MLVDCSDVSLIVVYFVDLCPGLFPLLLALACPLNLTSRVCQLPRLLATKFEDDWVVIFRLL